MKKNYTAMDRVRIIMFKICRRTPNTLASFLIITCISAIYLTGCKKDNNSSPTPTSEKSNIYSQSSGSETKTGQSYLALTKNETAVKVSGGTFNLSNSKILTKSVTTSIDSSNYYGLNATMLALPGGTIYTSNDSIISLGKGATCLFAYGSGAIVSNNDFIIDTAQYTHAIMVNLGGTITANNVSVTSYGANSPAIATGPGGGTITINKGRISTLETNSTGIYCRGTIIVKDADVKAAKSDAAVIDGAGSIALSNSTLSSSGAARWGVLIYRSVPDDGGGAVGNFLMTGDTLSCTGSGGNLFYVTNATANITLNNVYVKNPGVILKAASGSWGIKGLNGGKATMIMNGVALTGNVISDIYSTVSLQLANGSTLSGNINSENSGSPITVSLDNSSSIALTATSFITVLNNPSGISGTSITNITGNGFDLYYKASANPSLGGLTYSLSEGGSLKPY